MDEVFWTQIFEEHGKKIKCKSIGSKPNLLKLAAKVSSEHIPNVVIAMDRDYDHLRGTSVEHPQVLYTFGYSWESDIMLEFNFDSAISLFANVKDRKAIGVEFDTYRAKQSAILRRVFALDFKYIGHSERLFDRSKPKSIIKTGKKTAPHIDVKKLLDGARTLGKYQTTTLPGDIYSAACGVRSFFGKAVARLFYHWFVFRTSVISGSRKIRYETFVSNLTSTLSLNDSTRERDRYYNELLLNL